MLPYERKKLIIDFIDEKTETTLDEIGALAQTVSASTIRRDLKTLENEGYLTVYYGGIVKKNTYFVEQKIENKRLKNMDAKTKIAIYAASLVKPDETIFLDSGSTVAEMIKYLDRTVKVVTTSLDIVISNIHKLDIYLLGGNISEVRNSVYGISTIEQLSNFVFEKAFLGANGISEKYGITTPSLEETMLKQRIIKNTSNVFFLIDNSKIGNFSTCKVSEVDDNNVIMDSENHLTETHINITYPNKQ